MTCFALQTFPPVKVAYRTYGLTINSDLPLPGLLALEKPPEKFDLALSLASVPPWVRELLQFQPTVRRVRPSHMMSGDSFAVW